MAKGGPAKTPLRTTAQEGCIRGGEAPGLGGQRHGPFPSGYHLLPMVVVCPASSEDAHHGVRPSTVWWDLSLGFQGAHRSHLR